MSVALTSFSSLSLSLFLSLSFSLSLLLSLLLRLPLSLSPSLHLSISLFLPHLTPPQKITLQPGDILYVPRGCIHATHTKGLGTDEPSLHLTVGAELGAKEADFSVFGQAGGNGERGNGARIWKAFQEALAEKVDTDQRLRRTVPRDVIVGKEDGIDAWKEEMKKILHGVVDDMFERDDDEEEETEELVGAQRLRAELAAFREEMKLLM